MFMFDRGEVDFLCVALLLTSCKYNGFKYVWPFKALNALDSSHVYLLLCTFKYNYRAQWLSSSFSFYSCLDVFFKFYFYS